MSSLGDEVDPGTPRFERSTAEASNKRHLTDLLTASQADAFDLAVIESVNSEQDGKTLISLEAAAEFMEEKRGAKLTDEKPFDSQSKVAMQTFEWRSSKVRFTRKHYHAAIACSASA